MYNWEAKCTQLWFYIIRLKCSHFRKKSSDCHHEKPATYVTLTIDGLIKVSGMLYKHQLT